MFRHRYSTSRIADELARCARYARPEGLTDHHSSAPPSARGCPFHPRLSVRATLRSLHRRSSNPHVASPAPGGDSRGIRFRAPLDADGSALRPRSGPASPSRWVPAIPPVAQSHGVPNPCECVFSHLRAPIGETSATPPAAATRRPSTGAPIRTSSAASSTSLSRARGAGEARRWPEGELHRCEKA